MLLLIFYVYVNVILVKFYLVFLKIYFFYRFIYLRYYLSFVNRSLIFFRINVDFFFYCLNNMLYKSFELIFCEVNVKCFELLLGFLNWIFFF